MSSSHNQFVGVEIINYLWTDALDVMTLQLPATMKLYSCGQLNNWYNPIPIVYFQYTLAILH